MKLLCATLDLVHDNFRGSRIAQPVWTRHCAVEETIHSHKLRTSRLFWL